MSSFLDLYDATPQDAQDALIVERYGSAMFDELLARRPLLVGPHRFAVVTKHADCVEVLSRPTGFTVAPYGRKMAEVGLPVMLGADNTPDYDRDYAAMRLVMRRTDLETLRTMTRSLTEAAMPAGTGQVDVAAVTRSVAAAVLTRYLGLGPVPPARLAGWAREVFRGIFLELRPGITPALAAAAAAFGGQVAAQIDERRRAGTAEDTVLDRLLSLREGSDPVLPDTAIRTNLVGMTAGGLEPATDAVSSVVDALIDYPDGLAQARAAAHDNDATALLASCTEGLRLRPPLELLVRECVRPTIVAAGTPRAALIPAGHLVFVAISTAMSDPAVVADPRLFCADRAPDLGLTFGAGPHACFGRRIGEVLIGEIVGVLLRLPRLSRPAGAGTRILDPVSHAFVDSFVLEV